MRQRLLAALLLVTALTACGTTGGGVRDAGPEPTVEPSVDPDAPSPTPLPTPARAPGQVRRDPATLQPDVSKLLPAFEPTRRNPERRAYPYPIERLDLGYLSDDPLITITVGMLVADSAHTAAEHFSERVAQIRARYFIRVLEPIFPEPAEGTTVERVETPTPAPSGAPSPTAIAIGPGETVTVGPASSALPSPAPTTEPWRPRDLGEERALYAMRLGTGSKGYVIIWRRGEAVGTVLVVGDQEARVPDDKALALLRQVAEVADAAMRQGLALPPRAVGWPPMTHTETLPPSPPASPAP